eukprot:comp23987_c0_seq1/m.42618 comp23987_c0_seq1/g.42618  ORF comp23987_c0_seq1/g.42618 comp23987_c0_seq1/m.42618 type:complete len:148 (-) comp23987_c0_seq1:27-470(-)
MQVQGTRRECLECGGCTGRRSWNTSSMRSSATAHTSTCWIGTWLLQGRGPARSEEERGWWIRCKCGPQLKGGVVVYGIERSCVHKCMGTHPHSCTHHITQHYCTHFGTTPTHTCANDHDIVWNDYGCALPTGPSWAVNESSGWLLGQ